MEENCVTPFRLFQYSFVENLPSPMSIFDMNSFFKSVYDSYLRASLFPKPRRVERELVLVEQQSNWYFQISFFLSNPPSSRDCGLACLSMILKDGESDLSLDSLTEMCQTKR